MENYTEGIPIDNNYIYPNNALITALNRSLMVLTNARNVETIKYSFEVDLEMKTATAYKDGELICSNIQTIELTKIDNNVFYWGDKTFVDNALNDFIRLHLNGDPHGIIKKIREHPEMNDIIISLLVSAMHPKMLLIQNPSNRGVTHLLCQYDFGMGKFNPIFFKAMEIIQLIIDYRNGLVHYTALPDDCAEYAKRINADFETLYD